MDSSYSLNGFLRDSPSNREYILHSYILLESRFNLLYEGLFLGLNIVLGLVKVHAHLVALLFHVFDPAVCGNLFFQIHHLAGFGLQALDVDVQLLQLDLKAGLHVFGPVFELPHFGIEEPGWSKHLAWTNLYKLAPAGGGNPSGELCRAQFAACKRLLRMEVERLKPSIVLALTGWGWIEPFLGELGAEVKATGGSLVAAAGTIGDSRFVVAEHPQRKPEGEMVREVMRALKGV